MHGFEQYFAFDLAENSLPQPAHSLLLRSIDLRVLISEAQAIEQAILLGFFVSCFAVSCLLQTGQARRMTSAITTSHTGWLG
jgi:hypothetical protein